MPRPFTSHPTLVAASLAFATRFAHAQDAGTVAPGAAQVTLAREEFRRGTDAAHAARWPEALDHFTRADDLLDHARPEVLLDLAGAQVQTGHLVAGAESYRRFLRDVASGPLAVHRAGAQQTLAAVEARMPHVRIAAHGLLADDTLTVDDVPLGHSVLGAALPVDPGAHLVRVTRAGNGVALEPFDVAEGESRVIDLALPLPSPPVLVHSDASVPRSIALAPHPRLRPPRPRSIVASPWFWITTGIAAALVGAGVAFGVWYATPPQPFASDLGVQRVGP